MKQQVRHFVYSDPHLQHDNIYNFIDSQGRFVRPEFNNAAEGDAEMILRWNQTLTPQDHIWVLGDIGWGPNVPEIIKSLNGHKRLVMGNHDTRDPREYREMGFQKVVGCHRYSRKIWMTHIPMAIEGIDDGVVNIHGHIHEREPYGPKYRNVSVERIGYRPVLIDDVVAGKYEVPQIHPEKEGV